MLLTNASPREAEFAKQAYFCRFSLRRDVASSRSLYEQKSPPGALVWRNRFAIEVL
jgi:hypothetical protein